MRLLCYPATIIIRLIFNHTCICYLSSSTCACYLVFVQALSDWTNKSGSLEQRFPEFLDMMWPCSRPSDGDALTYDPLLPKARFVEGSPAEAAITFKDNLVSKTFAPMICEGEASVARLIGISEMLIEAISEAADQQGEIDENYEQLFEEVLVMCRALVAVASREYGICGSSESDVLALGGTDAGMCLLASIKQNEWFNAMFSEHQKCAGSLALLQPKVKAFVPQLKEAEAATSTPCETQLVLDGIKLLGECKVGLRPTQSDILEGLVKGLCKRLEESYMSELSCGKSVGASALAEMELYTSVVAEVLPEFGQGSLKLAVVSCQQQAGMEARFAALAELCSTWLDNQAKASEDLLEGLAEIRTSGAVMSGMQPACANATATIAAARSEMMRRLLQTTGSSDDGLSSDDLQVMAQYSETVKMLGGFASGTRTPDSADLLAHVFSEQWSAFQSFADYKALGDTAGTRVAADKDCKTRRLRPSAGAGGDEGPRGGDAASAEPDLGFGGGDAHCFVGAGDPNSEGEAGQRCEGTGAVRGRRGGSVLGLWLQGEDVRGVAGACLWHLLD